MNHHYRIYGLTLRSQVPIDGLLPQAPSPAIDCEIRVGAVVPLAETPDATWLHEEGEPGARITRGDAAVVLEYRDGTRFRIEPGVITTAWTTTAEDMATYLLGPVLALVLRQRGHLVLHASAVVVNDHALLFAGAAGAGKSTTATAFVAGGAAMLTDDVAAVRWEDSRPLILPGYPRLRLWDDSAAALFGAAEALPLLTPTWEKRYADTAASFLDRPVPLRAVVALAPREEATRIHRIHGHEAVIAVLARTSVPALIHEETRGTELAQVAELVAAVPVLEVAPRHDLGATAELVTAIVSALP